LTRFKWTKLETNFKNSSDLIPACVSMKTTAQEKQEGTVLLSHIIALMTNCCAIHELELKCFQSTDSGSKA